MAASFLALAMVMAIVFVTGRFILASMAAISIALALSDLIFGIGGGKNKCFGW